MVVSSDRLMIGMMTFAKVDRFRSMVRVSSAWTADAKIEMRTSGRMVMQAR
jgi:hypothetical protein